MSSTKPARSYCFIVEMPPPPLWLSCASTERTAEDDAANADALQKLTSKGLSLRDAFGRTSTARGRDIITNLHRTSFASKSGAYTRLRQLARAEGLVL